MENQANPSHGGVLPRARRVAIRMEDRKRVFRLSTRFVALYLLQMRPENVGIIRVTIAVHEAFEVALRIDLEICF